MGFRKHLQAAQSLFSASPGPWEVGVSPSSELRGAGESGTHVMERAHLQGDLKEKQLEE